MREMALQSGFNGYDRQGIRLRAIKRKMASQKLLGDEAQCLAEHYLQETMDCDGDMSSEQTSLEASSHRCPSVGIVKETDQSLPKRSTVWRDSKTVVILCAFSSGIAALAAYVGGGISAPSPLSLDTGGAIAQSYPHFVMPGVSCNASADAACDTPEFHF